MLIPHNYSTYHQVPILPSNMADDEQAIVFACTSLVVFMLLHTQILFDQSNKMKQLMYTPIN